VNSFARLGFILVGTFVVLEFLSGIGNALNFASASGNPTSAVFSLASIGFSLVFGVLPGTFVILRSRWLADCAVPQTEDSRPSEFSGLVAAAVAVLGVVLIIEGIPSALSSALTATSSLGFSSSSFFTSHAAQSAASVLRALAGWFLFRNAGRVSGWIRTRSDSDNDASKGAT